MHVVKWRVAGMFQGEIEDVCVCVCTVDLFFKLQNVKKMGIFCERFPQFLASWFPYFELSVTF